MTLSPTTYTPKASELQRNWRVIDATDRPLGRLASEVAQILKGKDKPTYTPHMDTGDFVIVVNASKVRVTGNKSKAKMYYTHSMYPGGLKTMSFEAMLARHPRRVVEWAVWGMLPKNRLGRSLFRKLKVYAEETHPHGAQIKDLAGPEKAGKPGPLRPPKKVRLRPVVEEAPPPRRRRGAAAAEPPPEVATAADIPVAEPVAVEEPQPVAEAPRPRGRRAAAATTAEAPVPEEAPKPRRPRAAAKAEPSTAEAPAEETAPEPLGAPAPRTRSRKVRAQEEKPTTPRRRRTPAQSDADDKPEGEES